MKLFSLLPAALALVLSGFVHAAQAPSTGGTRPTSSSQPRPSTMSGTSSRTATGGGGGGGSAGSTRQYTNSTMVGEAMITSDLQTRRLIVVTDEETNENIRTIIASLDQPKPQVLINVVFVQVTHNKGVDLGAEGVFN
ncbi:MAG: hypothetical protein ACO3G4_09840, partial [Opitutaceae bacterium]